MEHRCGYRRAAQLRIIVRSVNGIAADGQLRDISASGALLRTSLPAPPIGSPVFVHLGSRSIARSAGQRPVRAEVIRHVPDGFAVEWNEFSPQAVRACLRRLEQVDAEESRVAVVHRQAV